MDNLPESTAPPKRENSLLKKKKWGKNAEKYRMSLIYKEKYGGERGIRTLDRD
jgi:hypothetical protein